MTPNMVPSERKIRRFCRNFPYRPTMSARRGAKRVRQADMPRRAAILPPREKAQRALCARSRFLTRMRLKTTPTVKQIIIQYKKRRKTMTRESAP